MLIVSDNIFKEISVLMLRVYVNPRSSKGLYRILTLVKVEEVKETH